MVSAFSGSALCLHRRTGTQLLPMGASNVACTHYTACKNKNTSDRIDFTGRCQVGRSSLAASVHWRAKTSGSGHTLVRSAVGGIGVWSDRSPLVRRVHTSASVHRSPCAPSEFSWCNPPRSDPIRGTPSSGPYPLPLRGRSTTHAAPVAASDVLALRRTHTSVACCRETDAECLNADRAGGSCKQMGFPPSRCCGT